MAIHLQTVTLHPERYPEPDRYPFSLEVLRRTPSLSFETPVTIFVGENGAGKSTLLTAIARRCGIYIWRDPERRRFEHNFWEERLGDFISVQWRNGRVPGSFFGSDSFRDFTMILDEWAAADPGQLRHFGGKSLVTQSHGQSIMSFFRARYRIEGLYLLDEPETALSPRSQLELLELLVTMSQAGHAQFIMATHSPILLACPGATLYSFDTAPVSRVQYCDTEHYRVYRDFMAAPEQFLPGDGGGKP